MKSIALIHTVKSVASGFDDSLRNYLGYEVKIHNLWDDFLANNPNEIGEFTIQNRNRLFCDMKAQELTGADIIVTTCSTLTPAVELIRPFIQVPVIAIDDAMAEGAFSTESGSWLWPRQRARWGPLSQRLRLRRIRREGKQTYPPACAWMHSLP